jgi:hypothetical protein
MIDKRFGQVAYAVLAFGGLLHFGAKHFPVPWTSLSYNAVRKAYEVDITEAIYRGKLRPATCTAPITTGSDQPFGFPT